MSTEQYHAFLSYNTDDQPFVEFVATELETAQLRPWLDNWCLVAGDEAIPAMVEGLRKSDSCVVFVGPSGIGKWQSEEVQAAISRRVDSARPDRPFRVIPVLLPNAKRGNRSDYPLFLGNVIWVEFRDRGDHTAIKKLVRAIQGLPPRELPTGSRTDCPYRGLTAFDIKDADLFFGRDAVTDWILSMLRGTQSSTGPRRFIAIVGASGSGKSSLARAGLLAALKQGMLDGSSAWPITICRPGEQPLHNLAAALAQTDGIDLGSGLRSDLMRDLATSLRNNGDTLHLTSSSSLKDSTRALRHFVLIDQFEEVFTACQDVVARKAFIDNLLYAGRVSDGRTVVVITMRADFYGSCAAHAELRAAISENHYLLGSLNRDELRQAIESPALCCGVSPDPGVTELLLAEMEGQDQALPLMQHALQQLWSKDSRPQLTVDAYKTLGGLKGALKNHADSVFDCLSPSQRAVCQEIMVQLVNLADPARETRRRVSLADLMAHSARPSEIQQVVRRLADERLVATSAAGAGEEGLADSIVEVIHEALIRGWPKLAGWIDENRQERRAKQQFHDRVKLWQDQQRPADLLFSGGLLRQAEQWANDRSVCLSADEDAFLTESVSVLVAKLGTIKLERVPEFLRELAPFLRRARPLLEALHARSSPGSIEQTLASLSLLSLDEGQIEFLRERMISGRLDEFPLNCEALLPYRETLTGWLWSILESHVPGTDANRAFRAGVALAAFDPPTSPAITERWHAHAELVARQLVEAVTYSPATYTELSQAIAPAASVLLAPLVAIARHHGDVQRRSWATNLTAHFAADDPSTLVDLACDVVSEQYDVLFDRLKPHAARAAELLQAELQRQPAADANQIARDALARRQASAAATLLRLNVPDEVWSSWRHAPDPSRRSYLVHRVGPLGVDPRVLADQLTKESDVSAQQALILALGEMVSVETLAGSEIMRGTCEHIERLFHEHPDPGMHGAAAWTLRRWKRADGVVLSPVPARELRRGVAERRWHLNSQGHTLVLIPGPVEFWMGSPADEEGRAGGPWDKTEQQHRKRIGRSFALATHPVTVAQFRRFRADHSFNESLSPGPSHPINTVTWYDAASYCNWLSEQEGIPRDQWCYDPNQPFAEGMRVPDDFLERQGYRLPTESEWEYACRAGTVTSYYFGESEELLEQYAWYIKRSNSKSMLPVGTLKPNDLGLFDMHGNVLEWCHDRAVYYTGHADGSATDDEPRVEALDDRKYRVLRGGAYLYTASGVRSAYRYYGFLPGNRSVLNGFRVARTCR